MSPGIAAGRLKQDCLDRRSYRLELALDEETLVFTADDKGRREPVAGQSLCRLLKKRLLAQQR